MTVPVEIGLFAAGASLAEAAVFCVLLFRSMDRRNGLAWHMLALFGVLGVVLGMAIARRVFGLSPDHGWFAWVGTGFFCLVPVVFGWRLAILLRFRRIP